MNGRLLNLQYTKFSRVSVNIDVKFSDEKVCPGWDWVVCRFTAVIVDSSDKPRGSIPSLQETLLRPFHFNILHT